MAGGTSYAFGEFRLEATERRLMRGGEAVHLAPKAHDLLVTLVQHAGHLVTKEALLTAVWPDAFVEEGILSVHISGLRKALGDVNKQPAYIETVSRSGYRFIAPVTTWASSTPNGHERSHPLEAYELVGRGRAHLMSASYFELPQAVSAFQSAIERDPTYAAAHAGLALTRCAQARLRAVPHQEAYAEAKISALRALALDSGSADAQVALGAVLFLSEWDWTGAEHSLRRALEITPNHTEALLHYGSLMEALGQLDRALQFKQQALATHPSSPLVMVQLATAYWHQRRYDDAIAWAERALAIDARHLAAREFLAGAYWMKGDFDTFLAENVRQAEAFGASAETVEQVRSLGERMRTAYRDGGRAAVARAALTQMSAEPPTASIRLAMLHAEAGDLGTAFAHLDAAIASRDPSLVHLAVAPQWDPLRRDARFQERLITMGLPPLCVSQLPSDVVQRK